MEVPPSSETQGTFQKYGAWAQARAQARAQAWAQGWAQAGPRPDFSMSHKWLQGRGQSVHPNK